LTCVVRKMRKRLELPGPRELLCKESAEAVLRAALGGDDGLHLETVKLSGKSFGVHGASVVAELFSRLQCLKSVDLSDIIAGRSETEALQALEVISKSLCGKSLLEINLSNNALGLKGRLFYGCDWMLGIQACSELLS